MLAQDTTLAVKTLENELIVQPTPETFKAGTIYFENYELALLNLGVAVTSTTHLSIGSLFPVFKSFTETVTLGIKQQVYKDSSRAFAVNTAYNPANKDYIAGGIFGYSFKKSKFNFVLGRARYNKNDYMYTGIGVQSKSGARSSLLMEYTEVYIITDTDLQVSSRAFAFAVRLPGEEVSWELGFGIAIGNHAAGPIPLVKAGVLF